MIKLDASVLERKIEGIGFFKSNRGKILCCLGDLLIRDYITVKEKKHKTQIGKENEDAPGLIISYNCNLKKRDFQVISNLVDEEKDLESTVFLEDIRQALSEDLGIVVSQNRLLYSGVYFDVVKYFPDVHDAIEKHLFQDRDEIKAGARTINALAIGLHTKGTCYTKTKTVVNETGCGRVMQFGYQGIEWDMFLDKITDKEEILEEEDYVDYENRVAMVTRNFRYNIYEERINVEQTYLVSPYHIENIASRPFKEAKKKPLLVQLLNMVRRRN